jgi:hypothetical protein
MTLGLHSLLLQIVPVFFLNFPSSLEVVISPESPLLVGVTIYEESIHLKWKAHPRIFSGDVNSHRFGSKCRRRGFTKLRAKTCSLYPSLVQVLPVVVPLSSATLVVC